MQVVVTNIQELETLIQELKNAQNKYANYSQEQVDTIFNKAATAANNQRIPLAKLAVAETGMGVVEDKVIKNHFASEYSYHKYKHDRTCGVIEEDKSFGIQKIAEPMGVLAGIVPVTNPTSTTIFKASIALKTRNAIIFSPHPRAKQNTIEAARVVLEAAIARGSPEHIIGWIDEPTVELSQAFMQHPEIKLILATGGPGMVKVAYSSGHPSLGVGAGNTPAVIDVRADIQTAVSSILLSKTFDNGMICASEQSVIVLDAVYDRVKAEFMDRGAYFLAPEEKTKVGNILLKDGHINPAIVGQSVEAIAQLAEIGLVCLEFQSHNRAEIDTHNPLPCTWPKVLIAEVENIGATEPFSCEKLSPILAMYRASSFDDAVEKAGNLVEFGGQGHTAVLYINQAIFPQYKYPHAKERYAEIADYLSLGGNSPDEKIEKLVAAIEELKHQVEIPATIRETLGDNDRTFYEKVEVMAEQAFDDRCTGANSRYPLIRDLKELYILAYLGCRIDAAPFYAEDSESSEILPIPVA